jgi:hypothetical protein
MSKHGVINISRHGPFYGNFEREAFLLVGQAAGYWPDGPVSLPAYIHIHIYGTDDTMLGFCEASDLVTSRVLWTIL